MIRIAIACAFLGACIEEKSQRNADGDTSPADTTDTTADVASEVDDAQSCSEPGVTRCATDANATESCRDGVWQRAPCAENKICVLAGGAQCVDSTGDKDCRDTLYCFLACQVTYRDNVAAGEACLLDCYRSATRDDQIELSEALGCFDKSCETGAGFSCIAERCSQDLADCYFDTTGDARCGAIIECRLGCGDDAACSKACGADATFEAQARYAVLELCTFYACIGQDADCPRREALPTGACGSYASDCVGLLPRMAR